MNLPNSGPVFHLDCIQISKGFHHLSLISTAHRTLPMAGDLGQGLRWSDHRAKAKSVQEVVNKAWCFKAGPSKG